MQGQVVEGRVGVAWAGDEGDGLRCTMLSHVDAPPLVVPKALAGQTVDPQDKSDQKDGQQSRPMS